MIEVHLLGQFAVLIDGAPCHFPTKRSASLFAYLIINHDRPILRGKLISNVVSDGEEDRARGALNTCLWRIRKAIGGTPSLELRTTRDDVCLRVAATQVEVDALKILEANLAIQRVGTIDDLQRLSDAEGMYSGEFLDGFEDEWIEVERRTLRDAYLAILRKIAAFYKDKSEFSKGISYLGRLVELDPLDEDAHRDLMLLHYLSGSQSAALRQYERMRAILSDELGVPPSAETTNLWEYVRSQRQRGNGQGVTSLSGHARGSHAVVRNVPLVGREEALGRLLGMTEGVAQGNGSACVITGELGIGKTKLTETLAIEAKLRGFDVLRGSCAALETSTPYQPVIQALWPRIASQQDATGKPTLVLSNLIETLLPGAAARPGDQVQALPFDRTLLNECFLNLLADLPSRSPTVLILEDLHKVDSATEALLHVLLGRISGMRLLLVATVRNPESRATEVIRALVAGGADEIELGPLGESAMTALIIAALQTERIPVHLTQTVLRQTSGVPLYALELLEFLGAEKCLSPGSAYQLEGELHKRSTPDVPSRIAEVVRRRMRLLGRRAMSLLCAAAVLGDEARFDQLEQFMEIPEDEFIENVELLVEAKLLQETDKGLKFPHEMTRLAALALPSKAQLRKMHARAARLLEQTSPARAEDIAWHYQQAGEEQKALVYYEISGDRARAVHDNEDAVVWYTRSLGSVSDPKDIDPQLLRRMAGMLLKRQAALDLLGRRDDQSKDIDSILAVATRLGDRGLLAQAEYLNSQVLSRLNHNEKALEAARRAASLYRSVGDTHGEARALESIGTIHTNARNQRQARPAFRTALLLYRRVGNFSGQARALISLGMLDSFEGRNLRGVECLIKAEAILSGIDDRRTLASALAQRGILHRCLGESERSEAYLASGVAIMREIGDRIGEARGLTQLAYTHMVLGKLKESLRESLTAMRLARDARDIRAQIVFLNNSGYGVFRCMGAFRRAERYVMEAIRLVAAGKGTENPSMYYDTMAAIQIDKGDYESALRWAKQAKALYRTWEGHYEYVGTDIDFRLGLTYLHLAQYARAYPILQRAVDIWRMRSDLELLPHGVAALGELYLKQDNTTQALECAREIERLLRRVDGLEQIQKVYWTQYRIFRRVGAHAAARKALKKAHQAVTDQAATLKGHLRRKFLEAVAVNRDILAEVRQLSDGPVIVALRLDPARRIDERRRAILTLMTRTSVKQREIAARLGVSVRTVRSDVVALRNQGLLGSSPPP